jgi:two-component system NarL family sensor kinase
MFRLILFIFFICRLLPHCSAQQSLHNSYDASELKGYTNFKQPTWADTVSIKNNVSRALKLEASNYDSAMILLKDSYAKSVALNWDFGVVMTLTNVAHCYSRKGFYDRALVLLALAEPYALRALEHRKSMMASFYAARSGPYYYLNRYDSMAYYNYKAEAIASTFPVTTRLEARHVSAIYGNIALLWNTLKDYSKAIEYQEKAIKTISPYASDSAFAPFIASLYIDLGISYYELGNYKKCKELFATGFTYDSTHVIGLLGLGRTLIEEGKLEQAKPHLEKALALAEAAKTFHNILNARSNLGILWYKQKQYKKAEEVLLPVLTANLEHDSKDLTHLCEALRTLADINALKGNYKQAHLYEKQSRELQDSIFSMSKVHSVYAYEIKSQEAGRNQLLNQERLVAKAREARLREKNIWITAIGGCLVLLAIALISAYRSSRNKERLQAERIISLQQEKDIDGLKAMIKGEEKERTRLANDLHDGIMVQLSTVKMNIKTIPEAYRQMTSEAYIHTGYYQQIIQQMEDATTEIRRTAHNLMPDMLLQDGLAGAVFYFCNTLQQSTGLPINYQQLGDVPHLEKDFELSVYRIIQELIQNVLKHTVATKVIVQLARVEEKTLSITVEDDGCGFNIRSAMEGNGMGLKSIHTRVQVLNGMIDLQSAPNEGTTVHLEFDISLHAAKQKTTATTT